MGKCKYKTVFFYCSNILREIDKLTFLMFRKIISLLIFQFIFSGDSNLLSPNAFDPSEFPSLGNRDNSGAPNPSLSARPNYGNILKYICERLPMTLLL